MYSRFIGLGFRIYGLGCARVYSLLLMGLAGFGWVSGGVRPILDVCIVTCLRLEPATTITMTNPFLDVEYILFNLYTLRFMY